LCEPLLSPTRAGAKEAAGKAAAPPARFERRAKLAERCRFPATSFVVSTRRQRGVMVFENATEDSEEVEEILREQKKA
jgi:hypothetical protein